MSHLSLLILLALFTLNAGAQPTLKQGKAFMNSCREATKIRDLKTKQIFDIRNDTQYISIEWKIPGHKFLLTTFFLNHNIESLQPAVQQGMIAYETEDVDGLTSGTAETKSLNFDHRGKVMVGQLAAIVEYRKLVGTDRTENYRTEKGRRVLQSISRDRYEGVTLITYTEVVPDPAGDMPGLETVVSRNNCARTPIEGNLFELENRPGGLFENMVTEFDQMIQKFIDQQMTLEGLKQSWRRLLPDEKIKKVKFIRKANNRLPPSFSIRSEKQLACELKKLEAFAKTLKSEDLPPLEVPLAECK